MMNIVSVKNLLFERLTAMEPVFWFDSRTMELNEPLDDESRLKAMHMVFVAPHQKARDLEQLTSLLLELIVFAEPEDLSLPRFSEGYLIWGYADFFGMIQPGDVVENESNLKSVHFGKPVGHTLMVIMYSEKIIAEMAATTGVNAFSVQLSKIPYLNLGP